MRDLTKSMMSYTWAMSIFGVQQAANLFRRGRQCDNRATEVFECTTGAITEQFDDTMKAAFRAGDNLQRGLVDLMFAGMGVMNPAQWARSMDRMAGAAKDVAGSAASGFGMGRDDMGMGRDGMGGGREGMGREGMGREGFSDPMPRGSSFGRAPAGPMPGCQPGTGDDGPRY